MDSTGRPVTDRFCKECLTAVAKQRGSKIKWDGVAAEQPPAYFDYVFQFSDARPRLDSVASSAMSTTRSNDSWIDTAYIDESMRKLGLGGGDDDKSNTSESQDDSELDDDFYRRKRSHADRISTGAYNKERLLSDLYASSSSLEDETPI